MKLFFVFVSLIPILLYPNINSNGDFQIWEHNSITKWITPKSELKLKGEFRFGNDATQLYFKYVELDYKYWIRPWISVSGIFRESWGRVTKPSGGDNWIEASNPMVDISFYIKRSWEFHQRNRFQYIIPHDVSSNRWLYRNRMDIFFPWSWTRFHLRPVIFNEFFWLESGGIFQNRFFIGFHIALVKHLRGTLGYLFRIQEINDKWVHHNILRIHLGIDF